MHNPRSLDGEKIDLQYPCAWEYRVIGETLEKLKVAVAEVFQTREFTFAGSNKSKGGKYFSAIVETEVESEPVRQELFEALKRHSAIKIVL